MSGAQTSSSSGPLSSMSPAVAESSHLGGGHGTQYDLDSSRHLSPPLDQQATDLHLSPYSVSSSAMASPLLNSPSQSAFLRTAETLEGLARQLGDLKDAEESAEGEWRCCCGSVSGCRSAEAQERNEHKMKLSGEIGHALLQRYEALEQKHEREVERLKQQLVLKHKALTDSVHRLRAFEKSKEMDIKRFAEMSKKHEALEKRYTQAMHTQTLTQQSLTHVRSELTSLRKTTNRQSLALASGAEIEDRLIELERRYEDAKETAEAETRNARDEARKRKRAEDRIGELEERFKAAEREMEDIKSARARDAQDLLANAKERLASLHNELSQTFKQESSADEPEYQKALGDLVANNALLRHNTAELSHMLAESRDEARALRDELDELRNTAAQRGGNGRVSPVSVARPRLASELSHRHLHHGRTESSPIVGTLQERQAWARMSVSSGGAGGGMDGGRVSPWDRDHQRRVSLAPSFASVSTGTGEMVTSPGLGVGAVGEFGGSIFKHGDSPAQARSGALSPSLQQEGQEGPVHPQRTSPKGGIGYTLNGVPKTAAVQGPPARPSASVRRSYSIDRRGGPSRSMSGGIDATIPEGMPSPREEGSGYETIDEPLSPNGSGSGYFRAAEVSRKRRSLMLARRDSYSPSLSMDVSGSISSSIAAAHQMFPDAAAAGEGSSMVDQQTLAKLVGLSRANSAEASTETTTRVASRKPVTVSPAKKRVQRRTLLLLTRSQGVQTDDTGPEQGEVTVTAAAAASSDAAPAMTRTDTQQSRSETSSLHPPSQGIMLLLVEHLAKLLVRLQSADIPTLNKRLKKQHLPGADVGLLSQSTLKTLQQDVADLRYAFRGLMDQTSVGRKEFNQLLKLLKDVFSELIDLQALVNDVTIDPSLAKKLQKDAYRDEKAEEEAAARKAAGGATAAGLGWIAAPLTKFFVTPAAEPEQDRLTLASDQVGPRLQAGRPGRLDRGKLQPGSAATASATLRAPKQAPIASATTTHISVEFGAGTIRKATPVPAGQAVSTVSSNVNANIPDNSPIPPDVSHLGQTDSETSTPSGSNLLRPGPGRSKTLRPSKSRANRSELLGIFAGANQGGTILNGPLPPRLRAASSQYFADQRIAQPPVARSGQPGIIEDRKKLSAAVDAVIDTTAEQMEAGNSASADRPFEPLLERTLRPRGLSDSSIRTTFLRDEPSATDVGDSLITPTDTTSGGRAAGYGNMFGIGAVARRWYAYGAKDSAKSAAPDNVSSSSQPSAIMTEAEEVKADAMSARSLSSKASNSRLGPDHLASTPSSIGPALMVSSATSPARPIAVASPNKQQQSSLPIQLSASPSTKGSSLSPTSSAGLTTQSGGLLSILASSLAVSPGQYALGIGADGMLDSEDAASEDELRGAALRQGASFASHTGRRSKSRAGDRWT